jgi:hypothetical protein
VITNVDLHISGRIRNIYFIYNTILARSEGNVYQLRHRRRVFFSSDAAQIQQGITTNTVY